jgi:hypothetical protein
MADKGKAALTGAATGAAAGAALGPWGAAGGAVIGGALGYFGADDSEAPTYNPDSKNFQFGLGPSDGYAAEQAGVYNDRGDTTYGAAWDAQTRQGPQQEMPTQRAYIASQGQDYLSGAGADARARQIAALGGVEQANRRLGRFADRPEGPSAAQGLLRQATGQAVAQQNAYARSQAGGGGAALRNAAFNSAGIEQGAAAQAAQLRAQEAQAHRAQQLQALGAVQQGAGMQAGLTGQLRGADTSLAQAQAGQANFNAQQQNAYNQYQQGMEFQLGANNVNSQLQQQGQNNAYTLGLLSGSQNYGQMSDNLANQQSQMGVAYEQAKAAAAGIGSNNFNAAQQQSNVETDMMLGALSGATGAMGQMGGGQAAQGYTSDVRAKENIRPAEVARALGGQPRGEAWDAYLRGENRREMMADVQDFRARGDIGRGTDEFARSPGRLQGPAVRRERPTLATMRALAGGRPAEVSHEFGLNEPPPRIDYAFGPNPGDEPVDLRGAPSYQYEYKDPQRHGEGTYVGPMAQDLEHLPGVVEQAPDGTKTVNTPRLTLAQTGAISEQQRRLDRLERMAALGGGRAPAMGYGGPY